MVQYKMSIYLWITTPANLEDLPMFNILLFGKRIVHYSHKAIYFGFIRFRFVNLTLCVRACVCVCVCVFGCLSVPINASCSEYCPSPSHPSPLSSWGCVVKAQLKPQSSRQARSEFRTTRVISKVHTQEGEKKKSPGPSQS